MKTPQSNLADLKASAEREIGAFIRVVTDSFGLDEAPRAAEDWLQALDFRGSCLDEVTGLESIILAAASRLGRCS